MGCAYLVICYKQAQEEGHAQDKVLQKVIDGIKKKEITLGAALKFTRDEPPGEAGGEPLLQPNNQKQIDRLRIVAKPFFKQYDKDGNKSLNETEFKLLMDDLGETVRDMSEFDRDSSKSLDFEEFVNCLYEYMS